MAIQLDGVSAAFWDFFKTVDEGVKERDSAFLLKAANVFLRNEIEDTADMQGADFSSLDMSIGESNAFS